ncbi:sodium/glutamate symporter [Aquisalibacillus elongatus]|uniref:ESS family glutamate:Na+ symporter n=1 Tax=Aquisalibacillus elongatus TaxID=485577 RepID=A0A3N5BGD2_9BACI|nr:sodium/glutamate symporter [Aquisalibacillus elongatus]RPF55859.1 ESS family glutamate:Na+ symporter [Aquisalibacillus elongatus]
MTPNQIGFALIYLGLFLLLGKWLRVKIKWIQNLFLPSSVIAGFIGLLLGPQILGAIFNGEGFWSTGLMTPEVIEVWRTLPGLLINVVFATLFLGTILPNLRKVWHIGGPQLAFGWTLGWGQYVVGILLTLLILTPIFDLPPMVGALIEVGFEGGHGTAAGLQGTFEEMEFSEAYDLAVGLATIGILSGVLIGIFMINWAIRKQKTEVLNDTDDTSANKKSGIIEFENREPAASMTVRPESIEPLSLHLAVIAVAIMVGYLVLQLLVYLESIIIGTELMTYVPLFPLAMIGGIIVQLFFTKIGYSDILDRRMVMRIQGLSLDILILSAIATVSLNVIGEYLVPFLILAAAGILWNVIGFFVLAPKMITSYWVERAIGDFGQSMGITATGLLLMRVADPKAESPSFEGFGYKQLVFEPFLGGGLVTALSIPLIFQFGPIPFLILSVLMLLLGLGFGILYFGKKKS